MDRMLPEHFTKKHPNNLPIKEIIPPLTEIGIEGKIHLESFQKRLVRNRCNKRPSVSTFWTSPGNQQVQSTFTLDIYPVLNFGKKASNKME